MNRVRLVVVALGACAAVLACSSSSSSTSSSGGDGGSSGSATGKGFDCDSLRDYQAKANCPKFDGAQYVKDCSATKAAASDACKPKLDAFADCLLGQPTPGCTEDGNIDDSTPPACKSQEDAATAACK